MQRLQRRIGRFMPRTPNEADIEAMLRDFKDSDQMLEKIEAAAKQWRDAWTNILNHQLASVEYFHTIYKPLGAKGESSGGSRVPVDTPHDALQRCSELQDAFAELKTDMLEEIKDVDRKLIVPAKIARDALKPMQKAVKKREDKKVDYEKFKSRVEALQNKKTRSDRDNAALNKHEVDLGKATDEFEACDEALRYSLPRLNAATFSLLPHLLNNQIIIQNNLIGNLYTVLHQYSLDNGFPDPPPEPEEVIPVWDNSFTPLRKELEAEFGLLKQGKAIHQPMRLPDKGDTMTGLGLRNKVMPSRRGSSNTSVPSISTTKPSSPRPGYSLPPTEESGPPVGLSNKPSVNSLNSSRPRIGSSYSPTLSATPQDSYSRRPSTVSTASSLGTNGHDDYFGRPRIQSTGSSASTSLSPNPAAGKKKPPPPPPKKIGSFHAEFVTAMYDFEGQGEGDLSFREGDRIRVVKKTQSSQDWWEGELRGQKGSFPANYCK
ncbi:hypothetical protein P154DRAFT_526277 [Amniculicola lignicola CBS 123094]|uniref:SH3 domain signaling protein n=1 Tax=Amniculicola lignicola CBS 123094 TaxID=1392246 RepID=A0A6A5W187_9PLEO|nr:hypothetical protein P154DRAFT_526277 [Amniculicola lignicola CBS 123094]